MATPNETEAAIRAFLISKQLPPKEQWLRGVIPSMRVTGPLVGLQKTALFRMLASDLTSAVEPSQQSCLPRNVSDPQVQRLVINGPAVLQVLDIEDIGRSKWSQVEAMEMEERGEMTKGREIIRAVPGDDEGNGISLPATPNATASLGPHKLLVQDANGQKAYAMELESIRGVSVAMSIGTKITLRQTSVARGLILLTPSNTEILGGKVDEWDKRWREQRKQRLKEMAGETESSLG